MARKQGADQFWQGVEGPNLGYIHELYEEFLKNPASVDQEMRQVFERWGEPPFYHKVDPRPAVLNPDSAILEKAVAAVKLVQFIRMYGHLQAKINSVTDASQDEKKIHPSHFGLSEEDLRNLPARLIWADAPESLDNAWDVIQHLSAVYTGSTSYQFTHILEEEERKWLNQAVENGIVQPNWTVPERLSLLKELMKVEEFEHFLHQAFVGQKRFSIEGIDTLVPMLHRMIQLAGRAGAQTVVMGMAHRGRLNVLANVLKKPLEKIFSEFYHAPNPGLVPSEGSMGMNLGWTGDVKYHLGADQDLEVDPTTHVRVVMPHNPSHLELVGSVVEGYTRACQEERCKGGAGAPVQDVDQALAVLIHGDAAFPGEGIVAETLNLSRLRGYHTGGTIHIIANNQVGFTTDSDDSRSTRYASDLAKGFQIPIVHVNADDPEACLQAIDLAFAYRKKFHKDFLIDLIGFRRFGHNEIDDPMVTQPLLYKQINQHPGVRALYANNLQKQGVLKETEEQQWKKDILLELKQAFENMKSMPKPSHPHLPNLSEERIDTGVPIDHLREINKELLEWPSDFHPYPKIVRILERRKDALDDPGTVDWALAETLAVGTLLQEGVPVRMSGQDTERGTFAHRHMVLRDLENGDRWIPLQHLADNKASFAIYNSPLSETAVLGFEYGYDILAKDALVLWEAQYGDFVNMAQPMLDNFLCSGRAKWGQTSRLVLLLPHGYEGQGPEHSSARPERFLQLAAEENMRIVQPTSAAQYFHLLRHQAKTVGKEEGRPLIIFTPKGLLRHPRAFSAGQELAEGQFLPLIERTNPKKEVQRLIFCSGKIALDLEEEWEANQLGEKGVQIVRIEQLYPFPKKEWEEIKARYAQVKEVVWVQEEPRNMGAWTYMEPWLRTWTGTTVKYIGRPDRSSPAEGLPDLHKQEQQRIIREALYREKGEDEA